jgi:hypothetical protein
VGDGEGHDAGENETALARNDFGDSGSVVGRGFEEGRRKDESERVDADQCDEVGLDENVKVKPRRLETRKPIVLTSAALMRQRQIIDSIVWTFAPAIGL